MTFNEIRNERQSDINILSEKDKYYAHSAPNGQIRAETLEEHIKLVEIYFLRLIEYNGIELIIDNLIKRTIEGFSASDELNGYTKRLFYNSIIYHDFGKINHLFQHEKMKNLDERIKKRKHNESTHHSSLSTYFFLIHHFQNSGKLNLDDANQTVADFLTTCFALPIYKHHSSSLSKIESKSAYTKENIGYLKDFLTEFSINLSSEDIELFNGMISELELISSQVNELKTDFDFFPLFALLKLNYSLLTASDYLATSDYMNDLKLETEEHFGLITSELKDKLICSFDNNKDKKYNGDLIRETKKYLSRPLTKLLAKSNENLNFIRQKLGAEVLTNIEKNGNEKVFYIEAPTGGGKTNMSMVAARKLLEMHPEINKVFYVFPFTTLVTQTAKAIKETFLLNDFEIAQVHSKAGFHEKEYNGKEIDAHYGKEKRNQIDNLFVNYPFTLMTHIKFFDILKSNRKDTNYLLHRLANSIVIIDELQAYNPEHWDKIKFFIAQYAELFNIRFVIMSATLPKIDEIELSVYKPKPFVSLIENAKGYLQNPNFAGRVEIRTELLDKKREIEELVDIVFEKSKQYADNRNDEYKESIYTIIEFIFKNSASEFYEAVSKKEKFFDEIFVLSGTILEPRRKFIIEFLKDPDNRKKKILLITTQVVEAGVDIDMDLGFKNQSLIDSDEQLAGRINRNVNKQNCELYLFRYDTPKSIYGKDLRYEVTEKQIKSEEIKQILTEKDFKKLYDKVFGEIEKTNNSAYKKGLSEYLENFKRVDFKGIHTDFSLIESENVSVFVPINVDILCYKTIDDNKQEKIENNFSKKEIEFIHANKCFTEDGMVSGEKIWYLYLSYIHNKEMKFSIGNKILNGIMSKFVFTLLFKKADELKEFCEYDPDNGDFTFSQYLKLRNDSIGHGNIYDYISGINEKRLKLEYEII